MNDQSNDGRCVDGGHFLTKFLVVHVTVENVRLERLNHSEQVR